MEHRHQPRHGLRECQPWQPTAWQSFSKKVPAVTTLTLPCNATEPQDSCLHRSVKGWKFRKADWSRFCVLTDESVERLLPPDTTNIKKAHHTQELCEDLLYGATKQYIPRGRRKNYLPCWDKECETLYRSFIRAPVWTDSDRAVSSLISRLDQKIWVYLAITGKFTTWKRNHGKNARGTEQKPKIIESLPYDWWVTSITNQVQIGVTYTWEWAVRWSTQLRSQPVATQHSLRNCVDHLTTHRWIRCS